MSGGIREGAGRKAAQIDLGELEKLCSMHCSDDEVAAWFGVSVRTIQNRRRQPEFAKVMHRGKARGCLNVRRAQLRLLEANNPAMAIWLGKIVLGQRETMQITGPNGGPIRTESKPDFSRLSEDELRVLLATLAKVNGKGDA
jgi:hypothetical protein